MRLVDGRGSRGRRHGPALGARGGAARAAPPRASTPAVSQMRVPPPREFNMGCLLARMSVSASPTSTNLHAAGRSRAGIMTSSLHGVRNCHGVVGRVALTTAPPATCHPPAARARPGSTKSRQPTDQLLVDGAHVARFELVPTGVGERHLRDAGGLRFERQRHGGLRRTRQEPAEGQPGRRRDLEHLAVSGPVGVAGSPPGGVGLHVEQMSCRGLELQAIRARRPHGRGPSARSRRGSTVASMVMRCSMSARAVGVIAPPPARRPGCSASRSSPRGTRTRRSGRRRAASGWRPRTGS